MKKRLTMRWLLAASLSLFAAACGGGGGQGTDDMDPDGGPGEETGCETGQQDEDGDGVCQPDCSAIACENGTCGIDGAGVAQCSCDDAFTGDACDEIITPSADGVAFWIDASEGVTMNEGGTAVEYWADRSGNVNNGLPAVPGEAPTLVENVIGGLPVMRFDGDDDHLDFSNMSAFSGNNYTVFVVARPTEANNGALYYASDDEGGIITADYTSFAINHYHQAGLASGEAELHEEDYDGSGYESGEFQLYTFRVSNSDVAGWINGNNMYGEPVSGPDDLGPIDEFTLGANNGGGSNFEGDVAEMMIVADDLHYAERKPYEDYLAAKWFGQAFARTPSAFGAAHVWLDASQADTLTTAGTQVTSWANLGISGGYFENGTFAESRPELVASAFGERPALHFDGNDALVQNAIGVSSGGEEGQYTVIAVINPPSAFGSGQLLYRANDDADDERVLEAWYDPETTSFGFIHRWPSAEVGGDNIGGDASEARPMVVKIERSADGEFHVEVDGNTISKSGSESGVPSGDVLNWALGGEAIDDATGGFDGDIAEFIVLTTALGGAEEVALMEMLSSKWGI